MHAFKPVSIYVQDNEATTSSQDDTRGSDDTDGSYNTGRPMAVMILRGTHRSCKERDRCLENSNELAHVLTWASRVIVASTPPRHVPGSRQHGGGDKEGEVGVDAWAALGMRAGVDIVNLEIQSHTLEELVEALQAAAIIVTPEVCLRASLARTRA